MGHGGGTFDGWLERVHPADRERFTRDLGAFLGSSARQGCVEYRLRRASGEYVPVQDHLVVERREDGAPLRLVSMVEERIRPSSAEPWTRYRELFEQTPDAVFLVDADGRLQDFNSAFLELLGLTADEARGQPMARFYRDAASRAALVLEARERESVSDREIHLVASDGTERVVLGSVVASRDAEGEYGGHQAILHDITERSRRDQDRRRRADRLAERIGVLRTLYAISECLARAEELSPDVLAELVTLVPEGLRDPDRGHACLVVGDLEVAAPGFDPDGALHLPFGRTSDGDPTGSVSVSYVPPSSSEGRPTGFDEEEVEFVSEVAARLAETTRRIHAVNARRRGEAYHRLLVERSQDLLAILEADGSIRFASPAAERLLGYPSGSMIGKNALDLVHPEDRENAAAGLAEAAADPDRVLTMEHRVRHADGTWRYFESTGRSFLDDPDIRGIVVNSRDVTDRKGLEEQLRHAQRMEAVARLAGGVAHEFNNLLTVIRVSARLLEERLPGERPIEEVVDIDEALSRAAALTRRLLAFSGRDIRNPRPLDLAVVVEELEPFLSRMAGDNVEPAFDLPQGPVRIRADALQIEQIVLNLFENAVEAVSEGGRVTLEARTARPDELPPQVRHPDQWALLRVVDSGPGVPGEIRDTIFEPFFTTKETGTGLGLATVRSVVSRLGGFVEVTDAVGGGAIFTVCFPRTDAGAPPPTPPEPRADFPRGRTILVVDADPAGRSMADRILSAEGYRVFEAHDGVSALTLLDAYGGPLDLLVTAMEMPHVGGEELAARVLATHPEAGVLYVTGADPRRPGLPTVRRDALSTDLRSAVEEALGGAEVSVVESTE